MSAPTKNALTPEQDLLCRDFLENVVGNELLWGQLGKTRGAVYGAVLQLLGYSIASGTVVPIGTTLKYRYGQTADTTEYEGLFERDRALVEGMLDDTPKVTINIESTDEASTSESPESDEVGDVLLEDV